MIVTCPCGCNHSFYVPSELHQKSGLSEVITLDDIASIVCQQRGITLKELRQKKRTRPLVDARQQIMFLAREFTRKTVTEIGAFMKVDHTTVVHHVSIVKNYMKLYDDVLAEINKLSYLCEQLELSKKQPIHAINQLKQAV